MSVRRSGVKHSAGSSSASSSVKTSSSVDDESSIQLKDVDSQVEDCTRRLTNEVNNAEEARVNSEEGVESIRGLHEKIRGESRRSGAISNYNRSKLKTLYGRAVSDAEAEIDGYRNVLAAIMQYKSLKAQHRVMNRMNTQQGSTPLPVRAPIRRGALMMLLQQSAASLPLWIGKTNEPLPPLCGSLKAAPGHVCSIGTMVAAKVPISGDSEVVDQNDSNCILCEVISYNPATQKYEVADIDEEQREHYVLSRKKVTPLPVYRANPLTDSKALHANKASVLALYPQTTCFYVGVVSRVPHSAQDDYLVMFQDTTYPNGFSPPLQVPQKFVVSID